MFDSSQNILNIFGVITLVAAVNPYFLIPVSVLCILLFGIRHIYLKTSRDLKRLEGICKWLKISIVFLDWTILKILFILHLAKSPAFTHLNATLNGLSTIRAHNAQKILQTEFDNLQDAHTSCFYMNYTISSVFNFSLDTICAIYISCVILYYVFIDTEVSGDKIGLAISQAITLVGTVPWGKTLIGCIYCPSIY